MKLQKENYLNAADLHVLSLLESIDNSKNGTIIELIHVTDEWISSLHYRVDNGDVDVRTYNSVRNNPHSNISGNIKYTDNHYAIAGIYDVKVKELTEQEQMEWLEVNQPSFEGKYKTIATII